MTPQITIDSSPRPLNSQDPLSQGSDTPYNEEDPRNTTIDAESSKETFLLSSDSELSSLPELSPRRNSSDNESNNGSKQGASGARAATPSRTATATATFPKGFLQRYKVILNHLAEEIKGLRQNNKLPEEMGDDVDVEEWCICRMGDIDDNGSVKCDNPHCSIGWYHQGCLNHRDQILHHKYGQNPPPPTAPLTTC